MNRTLVTASTNLRALAVTFLLAFLAPTTAAQPAGVVGRDYNCAELPEKGPDPRVMGLGPALAAVEQYELDIEGLPYALAWAEREANPIYIPILKEIVEAYRCGVANSALALLAISAAGEPANYFLAYAADARRDDALASYAIAALEARNDRASVPALLEIMQGLPGGGVERGPRGFSVRVALSNFQSAILSDSLQQRRYPILEYIEGTVRQVQSHVVDGYISDGRWLLYEADPWRYASGSSGRHRQQLRVLAQAYPTAVRDAIATQADQAAAFAAAYERTPEEVAFIRPVAVEVATATAFPSSGPPVPPAVTSAAVVPSGCFEFNESAFSFTAVFSYASAESAAVRVPYGPGNQLTGAPAGSLPPEVFFPDGVPDVPGRSFRVPLQGLGSATWSLLGRTATVDPFSPRCGRPVSAGPVCSGQPATVYVTAAGTVVGGPLDGQPYAGTLTGTPGADVIVGTDGADAIDGGAGDDTICGLAGDDALRGGAGTDTADGGDGTDGCDSSETSTACEGAVPAIPDVRPVLECVAPATGGGFVAYFGYENRGTRAGRVAYGANNRITPAVFDRAQPDLFGLPSVVAGRPGRTPFYPGYGFTVAFPRGETVVWKLFNRTSSASASSPRCSAP